MYESIKFGMKVLFKETPHTEFWVHLPNVPEYRSIAKKAISVPIQINHNVFMQKRFNLFV